jgi:hypothetical protein
MKLERKAMSRSWPWMIALGGVLAANWVLRRSRRSRPGENVLSRNAPRARARRGLVAGRGFAPALLGALAENQSKVAPSPIIAAEQPATPRQNQR